MVSPCGVVSGDFRLPDYDTSQLHPGHDLTRLMYHRDRFAHLFRYTHIMRRLRVGMSLLDIGCGSGEMYRLFRVNRAGFKVFVGLDVRDEQIYANMASLPRDGSAHFVTHDIVKQIAPRAAKYGSDHWDLITCFEVIEHIPPRYHKDVIRHIALAMAPNHTKLIFSTPCYEKGRHSKSHVVDEEICEITYKQAEELLTAAGLRITGHWGTFANQVDVRSFLSFKGMDWIWDKLHEYYDHHTLSIMFAPLVPSLSRNCVWECMIS